MGRGEAFSKTFKPKTRSNGAKLMLAPRPKRIKLQGASFEEFIENPTLEQFQSWINSANSVEFKEGKFKAIDVFISKAYKDACDDPMYPPRFNASAYREAGEFKDYLRKKLNQRKPLEMVINDFVETSKEGGPIQWKFRFASVIERVKTLEPLNNQDWKIYQTMHLHPNVNVTGVLHSAILQGIEKIYKQENIPSIESDADLILKGLNKELEGTFVFPDEKNYLDALGFKVMNLLEKREPINKQVLENLHSPIIANRLAKNTTIFSSEEDQRKLYEHAAKYINQKPEPKVHYLRQDVLDNCLSRLNYKILVSHQRKLKQDNLGEFFNGIYYDSLLHIVP